MKINQKINCKVFLLFFLLILYKFIMWFRNPHFKEKRCLFYILFCLYVKKKGFFFAFNLP